jgi:RNA polymerase sigma factor (sigma-70 family)
MRDHWRSADVRSHLTFIACRSRYALRLSSQVFSVEPWRAKLDDNDSVAAWDLFVEQYRRLIFATIKHVAHDHDDVLDVFARVCEALQADDLARLRRYTESAGQHARFSTWLVTVVRNQAVDWLRHRDGRRRAYAPATLSPIQKQIFEHVSNGRSHVEAYELICARNASSMTFGAFLKELRTTYQSLSARRRMIAPEQMVTVRLDDVPAPREEPLPMAGSIERIARALEVLPPDERLAMKLFVLDEVSAAEVARIVGWPSAKTVYNRVYRSLGTLREYFERHGIRRDDL